MVNISGSARGSFPSADIACTLSLLRDVPFSAIYFTSYAHLKKDIFRDGENGKKLSFLETLSAAGIAGMPSAYLTTPAGEYLPFCL